MFRAGCVLIVLVFGASVVQPDSEELQKTGQALYGSLCQRCHGETGDSTGYPGITPLSGITLRMPGQEIAGLSAPFVGRTFEGKDAQALVAYLGTLKGDKGFDRPGYLFSHFLLSKKFGETREYRIIDVRPETEYLAAHIPNAVAWGRSDAGSATLTRVGSLGAGPETFIVVYDHNGGPQAAEVWWAIRRAGHERVALLDGGFESWANREHPVSAGPVSFESFPYPESGSTAVGTSGSCEGFPEKRLVLGEAAGTQDVRFEPAKTRNGDSLLPASELREYLDGIGITFPGRYALRGDPRDRAYLVFLLHLLGSSPEVSVDLDALCIPQREVVSALQPQDDAG